MKRLDRDQLIERLGQLVNDTQLLIDAQLGRTCLTCGYFLEDQEQCSKFGVRPPARVIVVGCPHHDKPPF